MKSTNLKELQKWLKNLLKEEYVDSSDIRQILNDFDFEAQQQVKVEPEVKPEIVGVVGLINDMIEQLKNGMERHKEYSAVHNRFSDKVDVLERLKYKISKKQFLV